MIKNYSNKNSISNSVNFLFKASQKRRKIAMENAKQVQIELGIAPKLFAIK